MMGGTTCNLENVLTALLRSLWFYNGTENGFFEKVLGPVVGCCVLDSQ